MAEFYAGNEKGRRTEVPPAQSISNPQSAIRSSVVDLFLGGVGRNPQ
jgi:hypothetical protein